MIDSLLKFTAEKLKGGIQMELLWTNSSPSTAQTSSTKITLPNPEAYDFVLVEVLYNTSSAYRKRTYIIPYNTTLRAEDFGDIQTTTTTAVFALERSISFDSNGISLGNCYSKKLPANAGSISNTYIIVTRVWSIEIN